MFRITQVQMRGSEDKACKCSFCYFEKYVLKVVKLHGAFWRKGILNSLFDAVKFDFSCGFFTEYTFKLVLVEFMKISSFSKTALLRLVLQVP